MNELGCLSDFFETIATDARISITHVGIYAALLEYRIQKGYINPIQVFSREIMSIAKLSSSMTYHKCVRQLSEYGYIRYEPSFSRTKGSKIYFIDKIDSN